MCPRMGRMRPESGLSLARKHGEEPVRIDEPFCRQCGESFPALKTNPSSFICTNCSQHDWHFEWARSSYHTGGQVLEAIIGFKYRQEYYHRAQLVDWLTGTFDRYAVNE